MRTILCLVAVCLVLVSCNRSTKKETLVQTQEEVLEAKDYVEILYFHGKQRCATCMAIENNAREAIEANFVEQIKLGNVVFKVVDITKPENEKIAEKYEVTWSSLFVVKHKGVEETPENMTEFAFGNARKSPDVFKERLVQTINDMLK